MVTEQAILNIIRKHTPKSDRYLHDDAAIVEKNLIVTTDTLVENTHFTLKTYTPSEIGWKAMAVNLSDIAAMGGEPLYALVSLSLPKNTKINWVKDFYKGILQCAKKYETQIIGGNLARSSEINITISLIGKTKSTKVGKRSSAKVSDIVFCSKSLNSKKIMPKILLSQKIVQLTKRVALMDSSDGLADCLIQIAKESKVKIIVDKNKITKPIEETLYKGEDYELVGTTSIKDLKKLKKINQIKIIGKVVKGHGAFLKQENNRLVKLSQEKSFQHF